MHLGGGRTVLVVLSPCRSQSKGRQTDARRADTRSQKTASAELSHVYSPRFGSGQQNAERTQSHVIEESSKTPRPCSNGIDDVHVHPCCYNAGPASASFPPALPA